LNNKKLIEFRESILKEKEYAEKCIEKSLNKADEKIFWQGAMVQAKEILFNFDEQFKTEFSNSTIQKPHRFSRGGSVNGKRDRKSSKRVYVRKYKNKDF